MNAPPRKPDSPAQDADKHEQSSVLRDCVREAVDTYLDQLDGHASPDLYRLVMQEVEEPLFEAVLARTQGNHSKAAATLGMNRGTLRKKLKHYGIE